MEKYISVPDWAKAEHMEMSIPENELWEMSRKSSGTFKRVIRKLFGRN